MSDLQSDDQAQPSGSPTAPRHEDVDGARQQALGEAVASAFARWQSQGPRGRARYESSRLEELTDACWRRLVAGLLPPLDPVEIEVDRLFQGEIEWGPRRTAG